MSLFYRLAAAAVAILSLVSTDSFVEAALMLNAVAVLSVAAEVTTLRDRLGPRGARP